jgi:hypothetical protein
MSNLNHEQLELALSRELVGALSELSDWGRSCPRPELLQAALAGVFQEDEMWEIKRHLSRCGFCNSLVIDLEQLDDDDLHDISLLRVRSRIDAGLATQ